MFKKQFCLILATLQFYVLMADPVVKLPNGLIRGREDVTVNGKTFYAFQKVPYAAPPVGKLRFQSPIPPENWEGVLNTTYLDVTCPQLGMSPRAQFESEDCLYLNVYTLQLPTEDIDVSLPVMLFIHGGGFVGGSSIDFTSDFIIEDDIILVTINYRLGLFGFLSTQDEVIPGNAGLKDQHLAIQWTHDNINLFGGDPNKVTIFGQSAGSSSCSYHLLNQKSKGLFSGAIMESGSFLMPSSYQRNARKIAFITAAFLNESFANSDDSVALLEYFQTLNMADLSKAAQNYAQTHSSPEYVEIFQGVPYGPVIEVKNENAFITERQYVLLQTGSVIGVPVLSGIDSEEVLSLDMYSSEDNLLKNLQLYDEHLEWIPPADMIFTDESKRKEMGLSIRYIYTGGAPFANNLGAGARYYSDNGFTRAIIKQAELYSRFGKTYFYQFSYDGERGGFDIHYDGAEYVGHGEELNYIFCLNGGCNFTAYPEADRLTSRRLVKIWTNFAKYQNPTPQPLELLQNITWPAVSVENGDFLYVNIGENLEIKNHPKEEIYQKWVELYNSLDYTDYDTY